MANNLINQQSIPVPSAKAQAQRQARSSAEKFTKGLPLPFPWLSTKGKMWTLNRGNQSYQFFKNGAPQPIEVVLADSADVTRKAYFKDGYVDGHSNAPDCASNDGVKPYTPHKESPTCAPCWANRMGSAKSTGTTGGMPGKACKDVRVLAVVLEGDIDAGDIGPISLRLPYSSHAPLAEYVEALGKLHGVGYDPDQVVSRMYFDPQVTWQVVKYEFVRALSDEELDRVEEMKKDGSTERITGASFDFLGEPTNGEPVAAPAYDTSLSEKVAAAQAKVEEPEPVQEEAVVEETPAAPVPDPSWVAIAGQPGVYFSAQAGGLVSADGKPWVAPAEVKPEPFKMTDPPAPGAKRERRATAGSTPKVKEASPSLTQVPEEPKTNGAAGAVPNPPDDLMSLMSKLSDKKKP